MAIDLSAIKKTKGLGSPPMICIHGTSGVGKTTFASQAPSPIFIQTEKGEGLLEIDTFHFGSEGIATSYEEVLEAVDSLLNNEHKYGTLVVDSIDHLEPLIWADLCHKNGWANIDKAGYGAGYNAAAQEWRVFLKKLETLRQTKKMAIILIAHNQQKKIDDAEYGQLDKHDLKLHQKSSGIVAETVDCVFFAKHKITLRKEDKGFGQTRNKGIDTGERVLVTTGGPHHTAKNRYNLQGEIPLSWSDFWSALQEAINPEEKETAVNG